VTKFCVRDNLKLDFQRLVALKIGPQFQPIFLTVPVIIEATLVRTASGYYFVTSGIIFVPQRVESRREVIHGC